jgi:UDP-3-O-[3-hydroxymyristoyl] glucosamine N-acyltransferase
VVRARELRSAGAGDLCFARTRKHWEEAGSPTACVILVGEGVSLGAAAEIVSPNPSLDFSRAARILVPAPARPSGIHPSAAVHPSARLATDVAVGASSVVGADCEIGSGTVLHANVTLYDGVRLGSDCELHAGVVLRDGVAIGDRAIIHSGAVLGADGFGYEFDEQGLLEKVPQVGGVSVGDDVEIGANTTIDRARLGVTRIGNRCKIDNLVQIAHNCELGDDSVVISQAGFAGGARLGRGVAVLAQAGVLGHVHVGDGAVIGARAGVKDDVPAGARMFGAPAVAGSAWHRSVKLVDRLPELLKRLRALERRVAGDDGGS